jgi:hypothetical protein
MGQSSSVIIVGPLEAFVDSSAYSAISAATALASFTIRGNSFLKSSTRFRCEIAVCSPLGVSFNSLNRFRASNHLIVYRASDKVRHFCSLRLEESELRNIRRKSVEYSLVVQTRRVECSLNCGIDFCLHGLS